jgi:FixJ family two-component response regulator
LIDDVQVPGMSGELQPFLYAQGRSPPIVFVSRFSRQSRTRAL